MVLLAASCRRGCLERRAYRRSPRLTLGGADNAPRAGLENFWAFGCSCRAQKTLKKSVLRLPKPSGRLRQFPTLTFHPDLEMFTAIDVDQCRRAVSSVSSSHHLPVVFLPVRRASC